MKKKVLLPISVIILMLFCMIINTQTAQARTTFSQGSQYSKGAYDLNAAQPTAYNWTRQSQYIGPSTNQLFWSYNIHEAITVPIVVGADGTIYFGSDVELNDGYSRLYAVKSDGTYKWSYALGSGFFGGAAGSPVIGADGTIYVGTKNSKLYAIKPDGTLKWLFVTPTPSENPELMMSPAIGEDGTIYVASGAGKLYALDPYGKLLWSYSMGETMLSVQPVIGADGTIYVGSKNLYAINSNGTLKWTCYTGGFINNTASIGADGTIYAGVIAGDTNRTGELLAINKSDGSVKWSTILGSDIGTSLAIGADGTIYTGVSNSNGSGLCAVDSSGKVEWVFYTPSYAELFNCSTPIIGADGTIYAGTNNVNAGGAIYAINPSGTQKWQFNMGNVYTAPAIGKDGTLYVGSVYQDEDDIICHTPGDCRLLAINTSYTVNFNSNGGSTVPSIKATPNSTITAPDNPVYTGNIFKGWYKDSNCTIPWNFSTDVITGGTTLYAKWVPDSPPVLNDIGTVNGSEGSTISFTLTGSDPDNDALTYSAGDLPAGASFDPSDRTFSWTPDFTQSGTYNVKFEVSDGSLTDSKTAVIKVANVNRSPVLNDIGTVNGSEGSAISFTLTGSDPDNDVLTYSASDLPAGASFDPADRTFTWTPDFTQSGTCNVNFKVSDGDLTDSKTAVIKVANVNRSPVLNDIGTVNGSEGSTISFTLTGSDPDNDALTYSVSNLPAGASFDPADNTFTWTPDFTQSGTYNVNFQVSDGNLTDSKTAVIKVANVNRSPVLNDIGTVNGSEGSTISFTLTGSDPDNDKLTYSANSLPYGATFDPITGVFTWIPGFTQDGTYNVNFKVSDGSLSDTKTAVIIVANVDRSPVLNDIGTVDGKEGSLINITLTGSDQDNDALTYSVSDLPKGASFDPADRTFTWTPDFTQSGTYNVNFKVSDGSLSDTKTAVIIVANVNRSPVLNNIGTVNGKEGSLINITLTGSDPDNDALTYSVSDLPKGAAFNPAARTFTWTPGLNQTGTYNVKFEVSDGSLSDTQTAAIIVAAAPSLKSITFNPLTVSVENGKTYQLRLIGTFSDKSTRDITNSATYSSSNKKVAAVDKSGLITANGIGAATIKATYKDGTKSTALKLTIIPKLKYITITPASITIEMDKKLTFKITAFYENGKKYDITKSISEKEWIKNSNDIISVSKGVATAKGIGRATINISYQGKSARAVLTVIKHLKKLSAAPSLVNISAGSKVDVIITAMFYSGKNEIVTDQCKWKNSNKSVAYIKNGVIYAIAKGTTKLTAVWRGKSISIKVTVK